MRKVVVKLDKPSPDEVKEQSEAQIQHDVVMFLQAQGVFCHSVPNESGGRSSVMQMQLVGMGLRKGVADLVVWWPNGRIGYVEMKDSKGRQRPEQKVFEKKCHEYGVSYDLCRSVDDVARLLDKYR